MYQSFIKRTLDIVGSALAIIVLSPVLLILSVLGAVMMHGNPFYLQKRAGKIDSRTNKEKTINLIKFRSMSNAKDAQGKLLPDKDRLNKYGRIIRATSLDELPSLLNIFIGDISFVGPRPLSVKYLPYYTKEEHHRHDVRPGLTGLAQINGRNGLSWEQKFKYDLQYIKTLSFAGDIRIMFGTVRKVLQREGIGQGEKMPVSLYDERKNWILKPDGAVDPNK